MGNYDASSLNRVVKLPSASSIRQDIEHLEKSGVWQDVFSIGILRYASMRVGWLGLANLFENAYYRYTEEHLKEQGTQQNPAAIEREDSV